MILSSKLFIRLFDFRETNGFGDAEEIVEAQILRLFYRVVVNEPGLDPG